MPHYDVAGQEALSYAAAEAEECRTSTAPEKIQSLLSPLDQLCAVKCPGEVLTDVDAHVFKAAHPLHLKLLDENWPVGSPLLPHVCYHVLYHLHTIRPLD